MTTTRLRARTTALAASAVALIAIAGCGSDDSSTTSSSSSTSTTEVSDARAELIAQGDQLCTQLAQDADAAVSKRVKQIGGDLTNKQLVEIFTDITLPQIEQLYEDLGKLKPPPEDAEEYQAILDAADEAIKAGEKDPESLAVLTGQSTPFDKVNELEQKFGFKVCGASDDSSSG